MPMSVAMPVMWVERSRPPDSLVTMVLCMPMMKHSSSTIGGAKNAGAIASAAPDTPNSSSNSDSSISDTP
ncbi:hypothetical protein D3C78_1692930 [compost metagenome]